MWRLQGRDPAVEREVWETGDLGGCVLFFSPQHCVGVIWWLCGACAPCDLFVAQVSGVAGCGATCDGPVMPSRSGNACRGTRGVYLYFFYFFFVALDFFFWVTVLLRRSRRGRECRHPFWVGCRACGFVRAWFAPVPALSASRWRGRNRRTNLANQPKQKQKSTWFFFCCLPLMKRWRWSVGNPRACRRFQWPLLIY